MQIVEKLFKGYCYGVSFTMIISIIVSVIDKHIIVKSLHEIPSDEYGE